MKAKTQERYNKVMRFIAVLMFIYGFSMFWVGFHNMDWGQNLEDISNICDIDFKELTLNYKILEPTRAYIIGLRQMILGFYITFISTFFIGRQGFVYKV